MTNHLISLKPLKREGEKGTAQGPRGKGEMVAPRAEGGAPPVKATRGHCCLVGVGLG